MLHPSWDSSKALLYNISAFTTIARRSGTNNSHISNPTSYIYISPVRLSREELDYGQTCYSHSCHSARAWISEITQLAAWSKESMAASTCVRGHAKHCLHSTGMSRCFRILRSNAVLEILEVNNFTLTIGYCGQSRSRGQPIGSRDRHHH